MSFRQSFKLASRKAIQWFPGHMAKGLKQMQTRLKTVDCVIEVHDARIPFSGRNPEFQYSITGGGMKPHILVLNKRDLTDKREQRLTTKEIREREGMEHVVFTNSKDHQCEGVKALLPLARELIKSSDRFNRSHEKSFSVMIIGVPNVGKSSLLNVLRNKNLRAKGVSPVGGIAGITRAVMERIKISEDPSVYMIDTPGILEPRITDDEMGMKLALIGCLPDHLVGEDLIADYLLYWLNYHKRFEYVPLMGLRKPSDNINEVLIACAHRLGVQRKLRQVDGQVAIVPDTLVAANHFIKLYRRGNLGLFNLDRPPKTFC